MLKKIGLQISTKRNTKGSNQRNLVSLSNTKKVGVLVDDLNQTKKAIDYLRTEFKKHKSQFDLIALNNQKEKITGHIVDIEIGNKDYNWLGQEKTETVKKIAKTPYDYLFCLNTSTTLHFENILSKSIASCRVGVEEELSKKLFDLTINTNGKKDWLNISKEMLRYINMLKSE